MGPYQRTPKEVASAIRFSGLGDFLERNKSLPSWELTYPHHISVYLIFHDFPGIQRWDMLGLVP